MYKFNGMQSERENGNHNIKYRQLMNSHYKRDAMRDVKWDAE